MTIRDLCLNVLIFLGVVGFIFVALALESAPIWVALIVAAIVWAIYIVLVVRDHQRDIRYPLVRIKETPRPRSNQTIYDQEVGPK